MEHSEGRGRVATGHETSPRSADEERNLVSVFTRVQGGVVEHVRLRPAAGSSRLVRQVSEGPPSANARVVRD